MRSSHFEQVVGPYGRSLRQIVCIIITETSVKSFVYFSEEIERLSFVLQLGSIARDAGRRHVVERVVHNPMYMKEKTPEYTKAYSDWFLETYLLHLELNDTTKSVLAHLYEKDKELDKKVQSLKSRDEEYYDIALIKVKKRIIPAFNETHYTINSSREIQQMNYFNLNINQSINLGPLVRKGRGVLNHEGVLATVSDLPPQF